VAALGACLFVLWPAVARAQQPDGADNQPARPPQQGQKVVLEPVKSGWVIAPDVQVTRIDSLTRTLVGAYGGWQVDDRLLLGAGGYWLPDRAGEVGMAYGGAVVGWTMPFGERLGVNARALLGGGQATLAGDFSFPVPLGFDFRTAMRDHDFGLDGLVTRRFRFHQGFGVAEPQAGVVLHVTPWVALNLTGGYRFIAWARGAEDQLRGPIGSLSVRIGAGS
jgi:hypothetical protein